MTVQPTKSALPPVGSVKVALQMTHEIGVVARSKMIDWFPQSLQEILRKPVVIFSPQLSTNSNFLALWQGA